MDYVTQWLYNADVQPEVLYTVAKCLGLLACIVMFLYMFTDKED